MSNDGTIIDGEIKAGADPSSKVQAVAKSGLSSLTIWDAPSLALTGSLIYQMFQKGRKFSNLIAGGALLISIYAGIQQRGIAQRKDAQNKAKQAATIQKTVDAAVDKRLAGIQGNDSSHQPGTNHGGPESRINPDTVNADNLVQSLRSEPDIKLNRVLRDQIQQDGFLIENLSTQQAAQVLQEIQQRRGLSSEIPNTVQALKGRANADQSRILDKAGNTPSAQDEQQINLVILQLAYPGVFSGSSQLPLAPRLRGGYSRPITLEPNPIPQTTDGASSPAAPTFTNNHLVSDSGSDQNYVPPTFDHIHRDAGLLKQGVRSGDHNAQSL